MLKYLSSQFLFTIQLSSKQFSLIIRHLAMCFFSFCEKTRFFMVDLTEVNVFSMTFCHSVKKVTWYVHRTRYLKSNNAYHYLRQSFPMVPKPKSHTRCPWITWQKLKAIRKLDKTALYVYCNIWSKKDASNSRLFSLAFGRCFPVVSFD